MALTSNVFIIFVAAALVVYYLVPGKAQWVVLLAASYFYYMFTSVPAAVFLVFSTVVTYLCALRVEQIMKNADDKKLAKQRARRILIIGLLLDLGVLAWLKYTNFMIDNINHLFRTDIKMLNLILPLGISYYTFQTIGYILDVFWGRAQAEKNIFKYALFVSFFPQIVQGPIGRFGKLAPQLTAAHPFSVNRIRFGLERILWGVFKKMVLADWAAVYRDAIFADPEKYSGIAIFGVLLYSVQLYGDFAGGIDIMIGVASLFGVELDENFRQPFFAVSLTDFWRRWHMTLGSWMKDYVMYPLTLSKAMNRLGKASKKAFGRKRGRLVPVCISNIVVFFLVGVWHDANWNNIGWGLYNGLIIAFSSLFAGVYEMMKTKLHINDKSKGWHLFMMLRTFIIINISWYFDCADSFGKAFRMMKYSVTRFHPSQFLQISSGKLGTAYTPYALLTLVIGVVILFIVSVLKERGVNIRESLSRLPLAAELLIFIVLLVSIPLFGPMAQARGFIYAQF